MNTTKFNPLFFIAWTGWTKEDWEIFCTKITDVLLPLVLGIVFISSITMMSINFGPVGFVLSSMFVIGILYIFHRVNRYYKERV